ncbi:MAG: RNA methyltransferase [Candidatus Omnitrophica bacterium]|nr:RNA methyltransferase [Candidatus Omnitrophota bacterium]
MRKLSHEEVIARQMTQCRLPRVPVVAVLDNIRSLNNVGSMFRTADGAGLQKLYLCGITGYPPQGDIAKTALGAEESVAWEYRKDIVMTLQELKARGYTIVILEQAERAIACEEYKPQGPVCLVVGNEVEGVSDAVAALADIAIEIPMRGVKNSLNVSVAFGVAVFFLRQALFGEA